MLLLLINLLGCSEKLDTQPCSATLSKPGAYVCEVPNWENRPYDVVLPSSYSGKPVPVILDLHGGGGDSTSEVRTSCPDGDLSNPGCLHQLADKAGYAVVYPNGNPGSGLRRNLRVWAAGGGVNKWRCVSGDTCEAGQDDVPYIRDLLDDLGVRMAVDTQRVYATGLSNGAAMSHRLACELSDRLAAVVPVSGGMQFTTSGTCAPDRAVPVLYIHGTEDPCWKYDGGEPDCPTGQNGLKHVSVQRTLDEWAVIQGCSAAVTQTPMADTARDGMTSERWVWSDCQGALEHIRVSGGGHVWPSGDSYLSDRVVGAPTQDFGSEWVLEFMGRHTLED